MGQLDSAEYKQALSNLRECLRIQKDLGSFNPEKALVQEIMLEMKYLGYGEHAVGLVGAVIEWRKTKNTYYMDLIQIRCGHLKLPVGPLLRNQIDEAASRRFSEARRGSSGQVKRAGAKDAMYRFMLNMIYYGHTLYHASRKAAWFYHYQFPELLPLKASVFEKEYRTSAYGEMQEEFFETWDNFRSLNPSEWEKNRFTWERIIKNVPDCSDDLLGERR